MKTPFPWFGGKSRAANVIWSRFGNVPNYVEPFAGSLAVLLNRPHPAKTETVNDLDCHLANFWRATKMAPDEVAHWADWPVNECDLLARHKLIATGKERVQRLRDDPDYYCAQCAGWWVWGISQWIGSGWCEGATPEQMPHLADAGTGVHRCTAHLAGYFAALGERIRRVRVCCGDWKRVLGPSVTEKIGMTAIMLDPPYADTADRDPTLYAQDSLTVAHDVREWAIANGENPLLRIALCGYEGEHEMPENWECVAWKTAGGYGSQGEGRGKTNKHRERIWFSPACLKKTQMELF